MKIDHPTLLVTSPAPGHYLIDGLAPGTTQTDEGRLVHPTAVHIPPSVPSDVLLAIVEARGDAALKKLAEIESAPEVEPEVFGNRTPEVAVLVETEEETGEDGEETAPVHGPAVQAILSVLNGDGNGTMRIKELAEASGVDVETIKQLSGNGYEVGNAGWVKLKQEGGEA